MQANTIALLTGALLLIAPATAQALQLGVSDAKASIEQRDDWANRLGATWERIIVVPGQIDAAQKIRDSHQAGRSVILTVGGLGTTSRHQNFTRAMRFIRSLPRAERYTISNEPDLDGWSPCAYRNGWMSARRSLGRRLLWGDFSPYGVQTFTQRARACGTLPTNLDVAVHPYQSDDPLAPTAHADWSQGCLGCLPRAKRWLKTNAAVNVTWWLTEFAYMQSGGMAVTDERASWLWPRAFAMARRINAKVLVVYTAQGPSWDTRPGDQAWAAIRANVSRTGGR